MKPKASVWSGLGYLLRAGLLGVAVLCGGWVYADYTLGLSCAGLTTVVVSRGGSFVVDLSLSGSATDRHNACILRLLASAPGLRYDGYTWESPYANGTADDDSRPRLSGLPVILDAGSFSGAGYPVTDIDLQLSNVTADAPTGGMRYFGTGSMVHLRFTVPGSYAGGGSIDFSVPDAAVSSGFDELPVVLGARLRVIVDTSTVADDARDDDGDGVPNLAERAMGLAGLNLGRIPMTTTTPGLPRVLVTDRAGRRTVVYQFLRDPHVLGVELVPEVSSDLQKWHPVAVSLSGIGMQGDLQVWESQGDPVQSPMFFRLSARRLTAP